MTHPENNNQDVLRSQEAFEQMVKERLQYAVRVALITVLEEEVTTFIGARPMSEAKSVEIDAMDIPAEIWKRRWDRSRTYQFHARVKTIKRSSLSAIIAVEMNWMVPLERCLCA